MSATGYTPISLYYSSTASAVPLAANLVSGELALNITDGRLYYKDNAGAVQLLSTSTTATGTANGVLYLNGSKVATSGSGLAFDGKNFLVGAAASGSALSGDATVAAVRDNATTNVASFKAIGGANQTQIELFATPSTIGLWSNGNVPMLFAVNNSEQMRLTSTGLGIGTSSPAVRLESRITTTGLPVTSGTTQTNGVLRLSSSQTTGILDFGSNSGAPWIQATDRTDLSQTYQLLLNPNGGNVGIGTSSPSSKLTISGTAATGAVTFLSTGTTTNYNVGQFTSTGGNFYFGLDNNAGTAFSGSSAYGGIVGTGNSTNLGLVTNSVVRATLDSSGNLGLGVTPSAWGGSYKGFQVAATGVFASNGVNGTTLAHNAYYDGTNDKYLTTGAASRVFQFNGGIRFDLAASGTAGNAITFTQAMTLDASGNLGIGTSSPGTKLDVSGNARFVYNTAATNTGDQSVLVVGATTSGAYASSYGSGLQFQVTNSSGGYAGGRIVSRLAADNNTASLVFQARNYGYADSMTLDTSGNLGLGVTPKAWGSSYKAFEITGAGNAISSSGTAQTLISDNAYDSGAGAWKYGVGGAYAALYALSGAQHIWYNTSSTQGAGNAIAWTQAMTLDSSGNWVIGATSAGYTTSGRIVGYINGTSSALLGFGIGGSQAGYVGAFSSGVELAAEGAKAILLTTNGSERARIDSSGSWLVGTTSTDPIGSRVNGFAFYKADNVIRIRGNAAPLNVGINSTSGTSIQFFTDNGTAAVGAGNISSNGSSTAYNTSSDYRLKDNQQPLTGSGAFIDALKPKTWNWKADGSKGVGFIAHEVQEVSPNSVVGEKDGEQMQAMEYGSAEFIANIVAELQSLRARVAQLEAKGA